MTFVEVTTRSHVLMPRQSACSGVATLTESVLGAMHVPDDGTVMHPANWQELADS